MKKEVSYKKTEKWWLLLVVLFYLLYNLPYVPSYEDPIGALWHGALSLIPLWITVYVGFFRLNSQVKLKTVTDEFPNIDSSHKEGV